MIRSSEIKLIQEALTREGRDDGKGGLIVPDDFFDRLNAQLNPQPMKSILERLLENQEAKDEHQQRR
jgi:hypothetical protein